MMMNRSGPSIESPRVRGAVVDVNKQLSDSEVGFEPGGSGSRQRACRGGRRQRAGGGRWWLQEGQRFRGAVMRENCQGSRYPRACNIS